MALVAVLCSFRIFSVHHGASLILAFVRGVFLSMACFSVSMTSLASSRMSWYFSVGSSFSSLACMHRRFRSWSLMCSLRYVFVSSQLHHLYELVVVPGGIGFWVVAWIATWSVEGIVWWSRSISGTSSVTHKWSNVDDT